MVLQAPIFDSLSFDPFALLDDRLMRYIILPVIAALISIPQLGSTQDRVGAQCRREIAQLCGKTRDRQAIRACLKARSGELTSECRGEI